MNPHYINRYERFIESRKYRKLPVDCYTEEHHIVPVSLGGEDNQDNIITLSGREHYIAHWILAKAYGGSMWCAFWMMNTDKRSKKTERYTNSYGYELARIRLSKFISNLMKDKVTCYDKVLQKNVHISANEFYANRDRYKHVSSGVATYVDKDGKHLTLSTNDERVLSGEVKHIRVGYKHPDSTIQKMRENSGIVGKILISNNDTGESRYIFPTEDIPEGFSAGMLEIQKNRLSNIRKEIYAKIRWVTNGIDNKRILVYSDADIPEGYHIGRTLETKKCPYCGVVIDVGNYKKHHGENCKRKGEIV